MSETRKRNLALHLPPLDAETAAVLYDLLGQLQAALLSDYGDAMENLWAIAEPGQPLYGPLLPPPRRAKSRGPR